MAAPVTATDALYALAVMSGVLRYCPRHETYYRGEAAIEAAMPIYDRHLEEVRTFFSSPVAFHTALKHARGMFPEPYCRWCTDAVRFN
jgi:hypothetical protein